jgi:YARHG domain-containing protein
MPKLLHGLHSIRCLALGIVVSGLCLIAASMPAKAQSYGELSCGQLWYERNAIYAQYGHCFKTAPAINAFGPGCFPPYGRLPPHAQSLVNEIIAWERRRRCTG